MHAQKDRQPRAVSISGGHHKVLTTLYFSALLGMMWPLRFWSPWAQPVVQTGTCCRYCFCPSLPAWTGVCTLGWLLTFELVKKNKIKEELCCKLKMKLVKETTFILKVPLNGFYYKGLKVCTMEMMGLKCQAYSINFFFSMVASQYFNYIWPGWGCLEEIPIINKNPWPKLHISKVDELNKHLLCYKTV